MKTPTQALVKMRNEPRRFFTHYPVIIVGDPGPSRPVGYFIYNHHYGASSIRRPGKYLGRLHRHDTPIFEISNHNPGGDAAGFTAYSIQMVTEQTVVIGNVNGFLLSDPPAHNYMVTGQLTGCSFCVQPVDGGIRVAHIRPTPNNAANLRTNLAANGAFAGHDDVGMSVYGSHGGAGGGGYDHNTENISIVGVYQGGWSIWAQSYVLDFGGSDVRVLRAADRIFP